MKQNDKRDRQHVITRTTYCHLSTMAFTLSVWKNPHRSFRGMMLYCCTVILLHCSVLNIKCVTGMSVMTHAWKKSFFAMWRVQKARTQLFYLLDIRISLMCYVYNGLSDTCLETPSLLCESTKCPEIVSYHIYVQGGTSGCSTVCWDVDIKLKVPQQYGLFVLKRNSYFKVNKRLLATKWTTLH